MQIFTRFGWYFKFNFLLNDMLICSQVLLDHFINFLLLRVICIFSSLQHLYLATEIDRKKQQLST